MCEYFVLLIKRRDFLQVIINFESFVFLVFQQHNLETMMLPYIIQDICPITTLYQNRTKIFLPK